MSLTTNRVWKMLCESLRRSERASGQLARRLHVRDEGQRGEGTGPPSHCLQGSFHSGRQRCCHPRARPRGKGVPSFWGASLFPPHFTREATPTTGHRGKRTGGGMEMEREPEKDGEAVNYPAAHTPAVTRHLGRRPLCGPWGSGRGQQVTYRVSGGPFPAPGVAGAPRGSVPPSGAGTAGAPRRCPLSRASGPARS